MRARSAIGSAITRSRCLPLIARARVRHAHRRPHGGQAAPATPIYGHEFIFKFSTLERSIIFMQAKRRPKGEGSITKLPNGNLKMTITLGIGVDGKQKRRSVTAKTKSELMQRVSEIRMQTGHTLSSPIDKLYFKDVVEMFFRDREYSLAEGTLSNYKSAAKHLFEPLYDYPIDNITPEMIDALIDNMRKHDGSKLNPSSVRHMKDKLSVVMNFAVTRGLLPSSPMKRTRQRKPAPRRVDTLVLPTEAQIKQLLKDTYEYDMKKTGDFVKLYPLFLLAIATGMRIGEILNVGTNNIDLKASTISILGQVTRAGCDKPLKTPSSRRTIYVQPDILTEVMRFVSPSPETTKIWCQGGKLVRYFAIQRRIRVFFKKCPYLPSGFTFHCFRHYHATQLLLKGINPKEVSKRLGHSSIKMTLDLYAHWLPEMDAQAANIISPSYIV